MDQPGLSTASGALAAYELPYADRALAGRRLAKLLPAYRSGRAQVLALPPGGVPIGIEVARVLRLPLDVLVAREIVIPAYPAVVAGALSEGGGLCLNRALFRWPGASLASFWREARHVQEELVELVELYHNHHPLPALNRRVVILVDDGVGSGLLQLAALESLRHVRMGRCVVATPYGAPEALQRVGRRATDVVVLADEAQGRIDESYHWRRSIGDTEAAALLAHYQHGSPRA